MCPQPRTILTNECSCGNKDKRKFHRYFYEDEVIGAFCKKCEQEWLQKRLASGDKDIVLQFGATGRHSELFRNRKPEYKVSGAFQAYSSHIPVRNKNLFNEYFDIGDHVAWRRPYGIWHHAIVVNVNDLPGMMEVIQWSKRRDVIERVWTKVSEESGEMYRINYDDLEKSNPPELVIARAQSRVGETGYSLFKTNCEAFATFCKIGVEISQQVQWFCSCVAKNVFSAICQDFKRFGSEKVIKTTVKFGAKIGAAESVETAIKGTDIVGAGIVIFIEGCLLAYDISQFYEKRKNGEQTRVAFMRSVTQRVIEALPTACFAIIGSIAGQNFGGCVGNLVAPGVGTCVCAFIGSIICGAAAGTVGKYLGSIGGNIIGTRIVSLIKTEDRAVKKITDLKPGDHIVLYQWSLHPRCHMIVKRHDFINKIRVIRSTYKRGIVEEWVDFVMPVYLVQHRKEDCYSPDEVIQRAETKQRQLSNKNEYDLLMNNCKHFAYWCKLRN